MPKPKRRFAINPGPLKVVPASQRQPFQTGYEAWQEGRCEAELSNGSGRCMNWGKSRVGGRWVCGVHARSTRPPSPPSEQEER